MEVSLKTTTIEFSFGKPGPKREPAPTAAPQGPCDSFQRSSGGDRALSWRPRNGSNWVGGQSQCSFGGPVSQADRPGLWARFVTHLGRGEHDTAVIQRFEAHVSELSKGGGCVQSLADRLVDFGMDKVKGADLAGKLYEGGSSMLGALANDSLCRAMKDYSEWRAQYPHATNAEATDYVVRKACWPNTGYAEMTDSLIAKTENVPDRARPALTAMLLQQTYEDMNRMYPEGWKL